MNHLSPPLAPAPRIRRVPPPPHRAHRVLGLLVLLASLTGACATARSNTSTRASTTAHPRPAPRAKAPAPSHSGEVMIGLASWYGREQHGGPTASGERFNMRDLTAAHRRLPFGVRVRVTNLRNSKSVVVRINDRGPYSRGRIIDLSWAAARALDMIEAGVVRVRIEVLAQGSGSS
jgi:rare lipoprotein A